jgi:galactokinase
MACALSQDGSALFLDCLSLETSAVVIPSDAVTVIMDTGTRRELKSSAYNERTMNCEQAVASLGVSSLREVSISDLDILRDPLAKRRAQHVVSENQRVLKVVEAFSMGDSLSAGQLFSESHLSLRDDYDVSGPALDSIVEVALDAPGCFGARMTGGGFAGSAVALVSRDDVRDFCAFVEQNFVCPESQPAVTSTRIYPVEACAGVSIL